MADYFLYILECADSTYYVGTTTNVEARERRHQEGRGCEYTSMRRPVRVVYRERHASLALARARERQLKRWTHAKKAALVHGDHAALSRLSASRRSAR
jgi:putative endonuclease